MAVVSAGFSKTHMTTAARAVHDQRQLALAITGAYPTPRLTRLARLAPLADRGRLPRLLERGEGLPAERVRTFTFPELLFDAARRLPTHRRWSNALAQRLFVTTWRLYGWMAGRQLRRLASTPEIYHYRAGYGQNSLPVARELGMHVVCDQALVHPLVLDELVDGRGQLPVGEHRPAAELSPLDRVTLEDIDRSDSILVNSDFVKETFLACGWPEERVHVIYLGVDDNFLETIPPAVERRTGGGPLRMMFAGRFERRKGADVLVEALSMLDEARWELLIAGPVPADIAAEHRAFLADPRVTVLGSLRRDELARQMLTAAVFVFPSYAEGSARVVFEALACGCYVITTPNSGTIVEDGVHGSLVEAGDAQALARGIAAACADPELVADIGRRNAALVRERYRQKDYGEALAALYVRLASAPRATAAIS